MKIFLVISTLITIYFSVATLLAVITSSSIGSTCKETQQLLTSETSISALVKSFGYSPDTETATFLDKCMGKKDTGYFKDLLGDDFSSIETLLNGMTRLENFSFNITTAPNNMNSISNAVGKWEYYKNGFYSNFDNVIKTLASLNDQVRCDNQEIQLNKLNCTASSTKICSQIDQIPTPYTPPQCASSTDDTHKYFSWLRDYF